MGERLLDRGGAGRRAQLDGDAVRVVERRQPRGADIAQWVETHRTPLVVDRAVVYDLSAPPPNT
ncbi:MAG: hypothetical protein K2X52_18975 [Mycobacteriaceae bacterium]|nr:hypothetical protein [Mycobacteriaceae bacterium]